MLIVNSAALDSNKYFQIILFHLEKFHGFLHIPQGGAHHN